MKRNLVLMSATLAVALLAACSRKPGPESESAPSTPTAPAKPVSMNKADYPVFPDADSGADPAVSAEQGGKGSRSPTSSRL